MNEMNWDEIQRLHEAGKKEEKDQTISNILSEVMETQYQHLEKFAAAFLKEVGSEKASEYQLVQQFKGDRVCWWWEKRVPHEGLEKSSGFCRQHLWSNGEHGFCFGCGAIRDERDL